MTCCDTVWTPFVIPVSVGSLEMTCSDGTPVKARQYRGIRRLPEGNYKNSTYRRGPIPRFSDKHHETDQFGKVWDTSASAMARMGFVWVLKEFAIPAAASCIMMNLRTRSARTGRLDHRGGRIGAQ